MEQIFKKSQAANVAYIIQLCLGVTRNEATDTFIHRGKKKKAVSEERVGHRTFAGSLHGSWKVKDTLCFTGNLYGNLFYRQTHQAFL